MIHPSVEAAVGYEYSLGNLLDRLGVRRAAFESDVRAALVDADTSPLRIRLTDSALIGRRPVRRGQPTARVTSVNARAA